MEVDSPKDRVILEYVWKSSIDPSSVTDEDISKLKDIGLSNKAIVEVQEILGLMLGFINFYDSLIVDNPSQEEEKSQNNSDRE